MAFHSKLEKRFKWYKKWHSFRYAQPVHYAIFAAFAGYDLYLAMELQRLVKLY
jgi:hypothetical protein